MNLDKLNPEMREIMEKVLENKRKRNNCSLHEFKQGSRPFRFVCKNCECEEDGSFVLAYEQGLKHGRGGE